MATRLTGQAAIDFAARNETTLSVHADGGEPARDGVTIEEAEIIAARSPDRVFVDVDETDGGGSAVA